MTEANPQARPALRRSVLLQYELKLADKRAQMNGAPYVCKHGFWVWNDGSIGPHFSFALTPARLAEILDPRPQQAFEITLSWPDLGTIDDLHGYAAGDVGSHTRSITSLAFGARRLGPATQFRFVGRCGSCDPATIYGTGDKPQDGGYAFDLSFEMPDADIEPYFVDNSALATMRRYIGSTPAHG